MTLEKMPPVCCGNPPEFFDIFLCISPRTDVVLVDCDGTVSSILVLLVGILPPPLSLFLKRELNLNSRYTLNASP